MTFSLDQFMYYVCILIRISGFVYTAPFFSMNNVPRKVKTGFSMALALIIFNVIPYEPLEYNTVIDFGIIVVKEVLAGVLMGFFANIAFRILSFAGHLIDIEIGFSMAQEYDPVTSANVTVSANLYSYAVTLMLLVTYMHHHILQAFVDAYRLIPVGGVDINVSIYALMTEYMTDYFIIAFRIVLPLFAVILVINVVLAILAKVAPQMNMFVIGMQLKVITGLAVFIFMAGMLMNVSDHIFNEMFYMMKSVIEYLR